MEIEELKLILNTITDISNTAGSVGLAWVLIHYFVQLATVLVTPLAVTVLAIKLGGMAKDAWVAPRTVTYSLNDTKLTPSAVGRAEKVINSIVGVRSGSAVFVHPEDVDFLADALDAAFKNEGKK